MGCLHCDSDGFCDKKNADAKHELGYCLVDELDDEDMEEMCDDFNPEYEK